MHPVLRVFLPGHVKETQELFTTSSSQIMLPAASLSITQALKLSLLFQFSISEIWFEFYIFLKSLINLFKILSLFRCSQFFHEIKFEKKYTFSITKNDNCFILCRSLPRHAHSHHDLRQETDSETESDTGLAPVAQERAGSTRRPLYTSELWNR